MTTRIPLNETAKVLMILELLLTRYKQCGLTEEAGEEVYTILSHLLDDNPEGNNTTLLEGIQIILNR